VPNLIPVGVSNRHMHLTREALETLFGPGSDLSVYRPLRQRGEFASEQMVEMVGPAGSYSRVRILGALRDQIQIEVAPSDARVLGIDPPIGRFGPLPEGQSLELRGPKGVLKISENVMISRRHIHIAPDEAAEIGIRNGQSVFVAPLNGGDPLQSRICVFGNVLVRVDETFVKEMHIDTDEANAAGLKSGDMIYVVQSSVGYYDEKPSSRLIVESDVRGAIMRRQKIRLNKGVIITPAARDLARAHDVFIE
jgi:putative phosphotransacetylase